MDWQPAVTLRRSRFAVPLALAVGIALLAANELGHQRAAAVIAEREQILANRDPIERLLRTVIEAESGQRGYLITGRAEYLEPYRRAVADVETILQTLQKRYDGDGLRIAEVRDLSELVRQKMAELKETLALYDEGKEQAWHALMLTDIGREKMQALDALARTMVQRENERIAAAGRVLDTTLLVTRLGLAALILVSLAALLASMRTARRIDVERVARAAEMRAERDRLEAEVERRTAELTEIARHLQSAREDERSRLARELHDELGGLLTAAKLDVARIRNRVAGTNPDVAERISHLVRSLDAGIALKRRIIEDLRPSSLSNLGLKAALDILCREFADSSEIEVVTDVDEIKLDEEGQLTVYRLVQEALTNIAKYAKARRVSVELHDDDGTATVTVRDDGVGFDPGVKRRTAHGLAGMRFRVQSAAGELSVHSTPGSGTTIVASLPMPAAA